MATAQESNKGRLIMAATMIVYGTTGVITVFIDMPAVPKAVFRMIIAALFLMTVTLVSRNSIDWGLLKKHGTRLAACGALICISWTALYTAYDLASVPVGSLCEYTMPIFLIIASVIIFGERITPSIVICVTVAACGMIFVSGVLEDSPNASIAGTFFGVIAGLTYAMRVIINKNIKDMDPSQNAAAQLISASFFGLILMFLTTDMMALKFDSTNIVLLLLIGIVNTGITNYMFVYSVSKIKAQTTAMLSYLDPVTCLLLSSVVLGISLSAFEILGAVMIIGATLVYRIYDFNKQVRVERAGE